MQDSRGRKRLRSTRGANTLSDTSDTGTGNNTPVDAPSAAPLSFSGPSPPSGVPVDASATPSLHAASEEGGRGKRGRRRGGVGSALAGVELALAAAASGGHVKAEEAAAIADAPLPPAPGAPPPFEAAAEARTVDERPLSPSFSQQSDDALLLPASLPSSSFPSSPSLLSVPATPSFPGTARGYIAYVYWSHWPAPVTGSGFRPPKRSPSHTELVPSIPTIFFRVFALLSEALWASQRRALYPLMDKKLLKPTGHSVLTPPAPYVAGHPLPPTSHLDPQSIPVEALDATRLLLRDQAGAEYIVTACRKEHVRLLYEGEAAVLARAALCPLLIDVYAVQGGKKVLVGGAGVDCRERDGGGGWECACAGAHPAGEESAQAEEKQQAVKLEARGGETDAIMQDDGGAIDASADDRRSHPTPSDDAPGLMATTSSASAGAMVRPVPAELELQPLLSDGLDEVDELTASDLPHALTPSSSAAGLLGGGGYVQPSHVVTPSQSSHHGPADAERERLRKKAAAVQKSLAGVQDQLRSVTAMCGLWEAKYKEEKDVNEKLWARLVAVQRQLRHMSRPLTTALASQGRLG